MALDPPVWRPDHSKFLLAPASHRRRRCRPLVLATTATRMAIVGAINLDARLDHRMDHVARPRHGVEQLRAAGAVLRLVGDQRAGSETTEHPSPSLVGELC